MEDEIIQKQSIQVVFLIDTLQFYENRKSDKSLNTAFRAISTSVLRLLTYFVNRHDCDRTKFTWGFQFFRIPLNTHFYTKRSIFREFTRNAFFDFEKQLEEEINVASGKSSGKSKAKQKQKAGFEVSPAFSLKYALHDACLEYRWDELIIASPLKSSRHKKADKAKHIDEDVQQQTKFVFAILPCPLSLNDLETFCEHKSTFSTTYLKRALINAGKQESHLFDILKASLFWLDTRNLWESEQRLTSVPEPELVSTDHQLDKVGTPNTNGLDLLNDTLALLRGRVIPLGCLKQLRGYAVPSISQLVENAGDVPAAEDTRGTTSDDENDKQTTISCHSQNANPTALPYSIALDYYTKNTLSRCGHSSSSHFSVGENPKESESKEMNVKLYGSHDKAAGPTCILNIKLMWSCKTSVPRSPRTGGDDIADASKHAFVSSDKLIIPVHPEANETESLSVLGSIFEGIENGDQKEEEPEEKLEKNAEENVDASKAVIVAVVSKEALSLDVYQSNQVYSCLGYEASPQSGDASEDGMRDVPSQWFQSMLDRLKQSNCNMIIHLYEHLVVLEPLTAILGSLRIVRSEKMMRMEKIIAFDGLKSSLIDDTSLGEAFRDEDILASLATLETDLDEKALENETEDESLEECQLDMNIHKETNSLKSFTLSCLEPWYRDVPQRGVTAKFLEQLVSLPENLLLDESINLSSALSQLKQLYKSEQNIPSSEEKEKKETATEDNSNLQAKQPKLKEKPIMKKLQARTLSIYENSQKVEKEVPEKSSKVKTNLKKATTTIFVPDKQFASVADLQAYVQEAYDMCVANSTCFLACAQRIVFMTVHFIKEQDKDQASNSIANSAKSLCGHVYNTNIDLVKKYQEAQLENCQEMRVREAKLQSLLRFEMEMASPIEVKVNSEKEVKGQTSSNADAEGQRSKLDSSADERESDLPEELQDIVDEISQLLCPIPILADHEQLSAFLEDVVFPSYSDTIPYLVKAVYEELGHPVPKQLKSPASSKPSVKAPSSYKAVRSWGSLETVPSVSTRSRTLSHHPSLADIGHKRTINIQPRRAKTKKLSSKTDDSDKEARRAKRNLFSDGNKLLRRESVALMEGISRPRRQSPRKHSQARGGGGVREPKVLKTRTVKETPGKRQVTQAVLQNVNRARKLEARILGKPLSPMVEVIEESPVKPVVNSVPRSFPPPLTRRLSFYSRNQLKDARRLSARITGSKLADITKTVEGKKSPARLLLKEVCTPSTLGSLVRLRSDKVTSDITASPDLKSKDKENYNHLKESDSERKEMISPKRQTRSTPKQTPQIITEEGPNEVTDDSQVGKNTRSAGKETEDAETKPASVDKEPPVEQMGQPPRKRTSVRTSLKKMFDGAVEEKAAGDLPRGREASHESELQMRTRKRKIDEESHNVGATDMWNRIDDGDQQDETWEDVSSAHGSPSKKKRRTDGERNLKGRGTEKNHAGETPSPRRKVPELLASPEMFKQWPQRKLRSTTPSPNGRFLRDQIAKKVRDSISESPELLEKPRKSSAGRSLRRKSKTCLKFPAKGNGDKESCQMPNRNDREDCLLPTSSSKEDLERHFSFNSDDDEIEFNQIKRNLSSDSLGREVPPRGNVEENDAAASPVFNESNSSMTSTIKSPFKSPWRSLRRTPCKAAPIGSESPIFHYVSTPNSTGMKLTLVKKSNQGCGNSESTSDPISSAEDGSTSESILESSVSSENDEVFASLYMNDSKPPIVLTPPGPSTKLTTKLSTKGLYGLLHSPFAESPRRRLKSGQILSVNPKKSTAN